MADATARVLGRPGVCMSQTVGAANIAAGLKDAYLSCSPILAFTSGTAPEPFGLHMLAPYLGQFESDLRAA